MAYIKSKKAALVAVFLVFLLLGLIMRHGFNPRQNVDPLESYPITRVIQYSYSIQNKRNLATDNVVFSVYAPVKVTANQKVLNLQTSHPYTLEESKYHNQLMHFELGKMAPFETRLIRIRAEMAFSNQSNTLLAVSGSDFLGSERYAEIDHPIVRKAGLAQQKALPSETIEAIYNFAKKAIKYAGYVKQDNGALYALQHKEGDCTEYAYLVNALSRVNNIPARTVSGYMYSTNATLAPYNFHSWAEVYLDGRWHIVDALKSVLMERQSEYVAMRIHYSNDFKGVDDAGVDDVSEFAYANADVVITMN